MNNQMKKSVLLLAVMLTLAALANASLIPSLASETAMGGDWAFNYSALVSLDERLDPAATNGVTCPGPGNTLVQCNPSGTFFTIYDIPGFVTATVTAPGWTVSEQPLGITPSTINGATFDLPSEMNVTFMYTGPAVSGPTTYAGFQIVSTASGIDASGHFTSQSTRNVGDANGTTDQLAGSVTVPKATVPEPDSLVLMGLGAAGILLGSRRRART
jgi:hypothetical protein